MILIYKPTNFTFVFKILGKEIIDFHSETEEARNKKVSDVSTAGTFAYNNKTALDASQIFENDVINNEDLPQIKNVC